MAEATSMNGMFTSQTSLGDGNLTSGSNIGHASGIERTELSNASSLEMVANGENINDYTVNIDRWVESLSRILLDVPEYMCKPGHPGRISRIPQNLREIDMNAYEPYFLSIGPYHNGKTRLQRTEKRKRVVLKFVLEKRPEIPIQDYLKEIKSLEPETRSFYSDVEMNSEEFVRMLLLDGLYILTVFCNLPVGQALVQGNTRTSSVENEDMPDMADQMNQGMESREDDENMNAMEGAYEPNDDTSEGIITPRWFWTFFMHDIFLLENQIPFFILRKIYTLAYGGTETQLLGIMKEKVGIMSLRYTKLDSELMISPAEEVHHILHLCHMFFHPTLQQESNGQLPDSSAQMFRLGSAVQLYEAGVNFQARSCTSQHSLLDITFGRSGKLVMSSLQVDDNTVSLLRNLIALEQMKYPSMGLNVSAYAVFLLHLITVPEDVNLLRREGIIQHHLASDKEMVYLVNRLSVGLAFDYVEDEYSLKRVFQELKSYSARRTPTWRAWLEHRYLNNPWTVISLMAATLLLLMSAVQTYYAVYSYYFPYIN